MFSLRIMFIVGSPVQIIGVAIDMLVKQMKTLRMLRKKMLKFCEKHIFEGPLTTSRNHC